MIHIRRPLVLALHVLVFLFTVAHAAAEEHLIKIGLVLPEKISRHHYSNEVLDAATEAFVRSRRFTVAERAHLDAVFTEKDLSSFTQGDAGDLSEILGVDILGVVNHSTERVRDVEGHYYDAWFIDVRLIDTHTGQILGVLDSHRDSLIKPTTPDLAGQLLFETVREAYPPEGYVIRLRGDEVTVDLGVELGIHKGDYLTVIRYGESIIHPVSRKPMPPEEEVIGRLKIVSVNSQTATCRVVKPRETQVAVADRVRFDGRQSGAEKGFHRIRRWKDRVEGYLGGH